MIKLTLSLVSLLLLSACGGSSNKGAPADLVGNLIEIEDADTVANLNSNSRLDGTCQEFIFETGNPELRMTKVTKSGKMYEVVSTIDGIFQKEEHVATVNKKGIVKVLRDSEGNDVSRGNDFVEVKLESINELTAIVTTEARDSFPGDLTFEEVILAKISDQDFEELADNLNFYCQ